MSMHTVRLTHHDGKKLAKVIYWCGRQGSQGSQWHFEDTHHLALAVGGSIQPCKSCVKAVIKELSKEL